MKVLAFDFGASSGRAMLGEYLGGEITLKEMHRFENVPITKEDGHLYWDIEGLFNEIKTGIKKCVLAGETDISAIGIDTWGVDFGLLDDKGNLIHSPLHYRDSLTESAMEEVFKLIPKEELYNKTGIQFMRFNTVFQLHALKKLKPELFKKAKQLLFVPDLLGYFLTGNASCEYTIASTGSVLNLKTKSPDADILKSIGIDPSIFPTVKSSGTVLGKLKPELSKELNIPQIDVIMTAEHDTASAVVSAPFSSANSCFLSCGTWSLLGVEIPNPITSPLSYEYNFTNEGGYANTIRYLKNISGLWLLQESRRQWKREGINISFAEIAERVAKNTSPEVYLDPELEMFSAPGDLPALFNKFFASTDQKQLSDKIDIAQAILESLALSYNKKILQLEKILGRKIDTIHIIGGGVQDKNLMRYTANATCKKVVAGPIEATSLGNIIVQLIAKGAIKDVVDARKTLKGLTTYLPCDQNLWEKKRKAFDKIIP